MKIKYNNSPNFSACNRTYTSDRGQIFSPCWPGRYSINMNCIIQIQALFHCMCHIFMKIKYNNSPNFSACNRTYTSDRGQIFSPCWPGRYSINMNCIIQIQALFHCMCHIFMKIKYNNSPNFSACNRTYTADRGQIFSPGWPGRYSINMNCIIQIQALFHCMCHIFMKIKYYNSLNFSACNRTYTADRGQIFSPGWPGRYSINMNCIIQIQAPQGTTVSLYFNSFHIEPHSNCNYDYLEVSS